MCRRLKGGRGAAAEGTGKVSFSPPHCPPRGEGADWVWEEGEALLSPACPCHSPTFLSSPILRALSSPLDSLHRSWVSVFQV